MRFLKNKIRLAQEFELRQKQLQSASSTSTQSRNDDPMSSSPHSEQKASKKRRCKRDPSEASSSNPTKNIIINYAKAISSFALSVLALPYLNRYKENQLFNYQGFVDFITLGKANIGGIKSFKALLVSIETDSPQVTLFKEIFKVLSITFVKEFSLKWIASGRVSNKEVYRKYRNQLLRKLENPQDFIYFLRNQVKK